MIESPETISLIERHTVHLRDGETIFNGCADASATINEVLYAGFDPAGQVAARGVELQQAIRQLRDALSRYDAILERQENLVWAMTPAPKANG